ncbi:hypothetical protein D3C81_1823120 [compost metagenome]
MFARLGNLDAQRLVRLCRRHHHAGLRRAKQPPAAGVEQCGGVVRVRQDLDPATDAIGGAHIAHFDEIVGEAVGEQQRSGQLAGLGRLARYLGLRRGTLPVQRLAAGGVASH